MHTPLAQVNESLRRDVAFNQQMVSAGSNYLLINGLAFDIANLDFYGGLARQG
jgi:UDP-glucose:glycoprotein glucosyltransferase